MSVGSQVSTQARMEDWTGSMAKVWVGSEPVVFWAEAATARAPAAMAEVKRMLMVLVVVVETVRLLELES